MNFELYTAERERCAKELFTVTMKMGELEEALVLEADGGIEGHAARSGLRVGACGG